MGRCLPIRNASCDLDRMRQIEREVDHDVIAFLRATSESIGEDARFIHLGLTSSDVVDTALGQAMRAPPSSQIISRGGWIASPPSLPLKRVRIPLDTVMIGRTHGMHAEPTTLS